MESRRGPIALEPGASAWIRRVSWRGCHGRYRAEDGDIDAHFCAAGPALGQVSQPWVGIP